MRVIYLILIILFVGAVLIFAVQNHESVTLSFLGYSASAPIAVVAAIMYVLGALTGGTLYALLRHSVRKL
jgi:lipopolysaccharide assembly protein A